MSKEKNEALETMEKNQFSTDAVNIIYFYKPRNNLFSNALNILIVMLYFSHL